VVLLNGYENYRWLSFHGLLMRQMKKTVPDVQFFARRARTRCCRDALRPTELKGKTHQHFSVLIKKDPSVATGKRKAPATDGVSVEQPSFLLTSLTPYLVSFRKRVGPNRG